MRALTDDERKEVVQEWLASRGGAVAKLQQFEATKAIPPLIDWRSRFLPH
jgi:hypothetical protein